MVRAVAMALAALVVAGCAAKPPARWAEGGAPLDLPRARWTRGDHAVDLLPSGQVLLDGGHLFTLDRAGRAYEPDGDPIALLEPEGRLLGKDNALLGSVGVHNASLPGREQAWLTVGPQGEVVFYDEDGDRHGDGVWSGCQPSVRTCTLVTHLIALAEARHSPRTGVGVGVGPSFGVGFGVMIHP